MKGPDEIPAHIKAMVPVRNDMAIATFLKSRLGDQVKSLLETTDHKRVKGKPVKKPLDMFERLCPRSIRGYTLAHYYEGSVLLRYDGPVNPDGSTVIRIKDYAVSFSGMGSDALPHFRTPCTMYAFTCQEYSNYSEHHLAGALSSMATHKAYRDADKEMQNAQRDQGGLPHASFDFGPNTLNCKKTQVALKTQSVKDTRYHYNNPDFMASTYRVYGDPLWPPFEKRQEDMCQLEIERRQQAPPPAPNMNNLWEGIIYIPGENCKRMGLPIYNRELAWELHKEKIQRERRKTEQEEEKQLPVFGEAMDTAEDEPLENFEGTTSEYWGNTRDDLLARCWYALPPNHILAWPLATSDSHRKQMGVREVQNWHIYTDGGKTTHLFCYLVPDTTMRGLMTEYNLRWSDRVDVRPFGDFGVTVAPLNNISQPHVIDRVRLECRIHFAMVAWNDPPADRPIIAPCLHPQMPGIMAFKQTPF